MTTTEYKLKRIVKDGFKIIRLGRNIKAERGEESYIGTINKVHSQIFPETNQQAKIRLEREVESLKLYIRGLEQFLYDRHYVKKQSN